MDDMERVLKTLGSISNEIQLIRRSQNQPMISTESFNRFISKNVPTMIRTVQVLEDITNRIIARFDQMMTYKNRTMEIASLVSFAEWTALPNADSLEHLMDRLHLTMFGHTSNEIHRKTPQATLLYQMMSNYEEALDERSRTLQSPQQFIGSLYTDIAIIELKGYTLMEFSLLILRVTGHGNFTEETNIMRENFKKRTEYSLSFLRDVMEQSDLRIWRSDPPNHIAGITYIEVTRLLQGYIENEDGLNAGRWCRYSCETYQNTTVSGCISGAICQTVPQCLGRVYNCQFVEKSMGICKSPDDSSRRYEYIQLNNGRVLGTKKYCRRDTTEAESWYRWFFWGCDYCFCLCDEPGPNSDRYFNLRETVSDVKANKVVTGVRFAKKNRIIHLQIQEGQLLPQGAINESTVEWKPVDDYLISSYNVIDGRDFHIMSFDSRGINLAEVMKTDDKSFVVTGVRLRLSNGRLNLELQFTKYDFKTGNLMENVWQACKALPNVQLDLNDMDIPTKSPQLSKQLSNDYNYLEFVNTGINQDAAQTTIPFIDIQDVVSKDPVPLAGIGIYYKAVPGYGGFIAPKIIQYDFTPHTPVQVSLN
ncbi:uncharacterized protein LOC133839535 [Drosophila sulfurigaster albostrigata]|uniref:uncharacterized protein LOC133839535 n=1 Tax=Drosophila sulfurigaster albostrigata TaxID=89887 RepID=UPI002D219ECB|nr:uncharacterized protein LOC133839535 [Drosophila sulfurigaster albostrigata]